jgi:hypothetical protein
VQDAHADDGFFKAEVATVKDERSVVSEFKLSRKEKIRKIVFNSSKYCKRQHSPEEEEHFNATNGNFKAKTILLNSGKFMSIPFAN